MIPSFHGTALRISKRNADFYSQSLFNVTKDREVYTIELRKTKRMATIYNRRRKFTPKALYSGYCKHSELKSETLSQKYSFSNDFSYSEDTTQNSQVIFRPESICELCQLALKEAILNQCPSTSILEKLKDIFCITQNSIDITNPALFNLIKLISPEDINISVYLMKILSEIVKNIYSACLFIIQSDIFEPLMNSFNNLPVLSTSIIELLGNIARVGILSTKSKSSIINICVRILETCAHDMTDCIDCINTICYNDQASIENFIDIRGLDYAINHYHLQSLKIVDFFQLIECLSTGTKYQILEMLDLNILDFLLERFSDEDHGTKLHILAILSNIAISSKSSCTILIQHAIFINAMDECNNNLCECRKAASYVLRNFITRASDNDILRALALGAHNILLDGLQDTEVMCLRHFLFCSYIILRLHQEKKYELDEFIDIGQWTQSLSRLSLHSNNEIHEKAEFLLQNFFS